MAAACSGGTQPFTSIYRDIGIALQVILLLLVVYVTELLAKGFGNAQTLHMNYVHTGQWV